MLMRAHPTRRAALTAMLTAVAAPAFAEGAKKPVAPKVTSGASGDAWNSLPPTPVLLRPVRSETAAIGKARLWFAEYAIGGSGGEAPVEVRAPATTRSDGAARPNAAAPIPSRDPVLFLHGGFGHSAFWGSQVADLARDRRVIAMDTRGHGRSPMPVGEFGFAAFARDVDALLTHLAIPAISIVGWSDGGITALQLAMTKPERVNRMVLFGANATPGGLIPGGSKLPAFAAYAARCRADYARISPTPDRWADLTSGLSAMWRREPNFAMGALGTIGARTLVLAADHDEIIRRDHAALIARAIPGATFAELKGVSHFAMLQAPGAFSGAVRGFLDAV